jgi:DNA-binding LacI/PurR family transcriptional regulator
MPVSLIRPFPAVNQASHVSAKTREKVEAAMAQLNYIPNRVAQQLAGNSRC